MIGNAFWSQVNNHLQLSVTTENERYAANEPIVLVAEYRNVGDTALVLKVNGWSLPDNPKKGRRLPFDLSPLYSMERIILSRDSNDSPALAIRATMSNMFLLWRIITLASGTVYTERALLSTRFWQHVNGSKTIAGSLDDGMPVCSPGCYLLEAVYSSPGINSTTVGKMRLFQQLPEHERTIDAYLQLELGFSYHEFECLAQGNFNMWSGRLQSPPCKFEVVAPCT